ncbi:L-asparaginase 1, partial [Marichromatium gracile]|nr:L-asparaginase 1 [Marichromatium gracile]
MQAANNVMVLYTGGTIGMQASANGLTPASGFEARM